MFMVDNHKHELNLDREIVSLGNYCLTSMILKDNGLKNFSYPFDWMVTCIDNIIHSIKDDFKQFLNTDNYLLINGSNGTRNKFYFAQTTKLFGGLTKIMTDHQHHNLLIGDDYEYLNRCVTRFNELGKYKELVFVMIQPLYLLNTTVEKEKYITLYNLLKAKFPVKIKLFIFNITKVVNDVFREDIIHENLIIYELKAKIVKGSYGMQWYDAGGWTKLLEIIGKK